MLKVEEWGLRILGVDIDETFGLQQLIIQAIRIEYARREKAMKGDAPWEDWKYVLPVFLSK